jgi:hypothetical protein
MRRVRMSRSVSVVGVLVGYGVLAGSAWGAVTPGWECVPTTAGQAVVSGGTGATPSCGSGKTAVLAPTYVPSGVGGKPTVQFAAVNVQIVSGSGSTTGAVNGEGNLVIGYAENANNYSRVGSHDLVVGANNGWKSYGQIVGGTKNQATGNFATVFGSANTASGGSSFAAGESNTASGAAASVTGGAHNAAKGADSSVTGGEFNTASSSFTSITGGCSNLTGPGTLPFNPTCLDSTGHPNSFAAVTGGSFNHATGIDAAVSGGDTNNASARDASVSGGESNTASAVSASVSGGDTNNASATDASVSGGEINTASAVFASVSGGQQNNADSTFSAVLGGCGNLTSSDTSDPPHNDNCDFASGSQLQTIAGGVYNLATGTFAAVGGGGFNKATGGGSAVSGGNTKTASVNYHTQVGPSDFAP